MSTRTSTKAMKVKPVPRLTDADVRRAEDEGLYVEIMVPEREDNGVRGRIAGRGFACDRHRRVHGCHVLLNLLDDAGHFHFVEADACALASVIDAVPPAVVQCSLFET